MVTKFSIPRFGVTVSLVDIVAIRDPQNTATAAWFSILFSKSLQFQVFDVVKPKTFSEADWRQMVRDLRESHRLLHEAWLAVEPKLFDKGHPYHALPLSSKPGSPGNSSSY